MTTSSARHRLIARRAARWALLGAIAGAAAWGLAWLYYPPVFHGPAEPPSFLSHVPRLVLPGLAFGIAAGIALRRRGLSDWRHVALLTGVSILAWLVTAAAVVVTSPDVELGLIALFMGLVWGAVQVAGTAAIFPFARRRGLWLAVIAAGAGTFWLVATVIPSELDHHLDLLVFWSSLYAVHAAILSTALPSDAH